MKKRASWAGFVLWAVFFGLVSFAGAAVASAQTGPRPLGEYQGVVPGTGNAPPQAARAAGSLVMTWPGFQARADGGSRFFVQTSQPVSHQLLTENGRVVILLSNTSIQLTNNRRSLETRYFNSPATRARIERRGRNVAIVLEMRSQSTPRVRSESGAHGFHYLFIEFGPGSHQ